MLKGLNRRITLHGINKPREVRFGGRLENDMQISGIMFDVNYKEPRTGDRAARETIRIKGWADKVRYRRCLRKV